jgi:Inner membrane protein YgaP-like, transmembrane domain
VRAERIANPDEVIKREGAVIMAFSKFMASTAGRTIRVIAGVALIVVGGMLGGGWWALAVVGLVPLAAGALDICLFNVLFRQPLSGKAVRAS